MNPAVTGSKLYRPPIEDGSKFGVQANSGGRRYAAKHDADNPPVPKVPRPEHVRTERIPVVREVGESTRRVDVAHLQVPVPLGPRPAAPELVVAPAEVVAVPTEPLAPVTDGLLRRVLRWLKESR